MATQEVVLVPPTPADTSQLALLADLQYLEPMGSEALNRKLRGITSRGVYRGFTYSLPGAMTLRIGAGNAPGTAVVEVGQVAITVQQVKTVDLTVPANFDGYLVLEATYGLGVITKQVSTDSTIDAAALKLVTKAARLPDQVILYSIRTPPGTLTLLASHITETGREYPPLDWARITTGKPTTLAGYGIVDAAPLSHVGATGAAHGAVTQSVNGFMIAADKAKLDGMASSAGLGVKATAKVATTANLTATYANGTAGVGATLTNSGTLEALSIDGLAVAANDRVLVKNQTTTAQNGIYTVTNIGSASVAWILTRAADADTNADLAAAMVSIEKGTAGAGKIFANITKGTDTIGTTAVAWYEMPMIGTALGASKAVVTDSSGRLTTSVTATELGLLAGAGSTLLKDQLAAKQDVNKKGQPDGYAGLDSNGKIAAGQLPALAFTDTFVCANQAAMLALTAEVGDVAIRTDESKSYILTTEPASTLANWQELRASQSISGNAATATKLATARQINGTNFDGSGNITTANWGTARTLTIGDAAKSVNGAGNVSWSLAEIGAAPAGFGLGGYCASLAGDLNTVLRTRSGFYNADAASVTNGFQPSGWCYYMNMAHGNAAGYNGLLAMSFNGAHLGFKTVEAGADKGWKTIYHTGNKPTSADVGLGSVNNWAASGAVNLASDTTYATAGAVKSAYDLAAAALPKAGGVVTGVIRFTGASGGISIHPTADNATGIFNGTGDGAAQDKTNIQIKSWYGIGISPTAGSSLAAGLNSLWINARTGDVWTIGELYAQTDKKVYHQGFKPTSGDVGLGNVSNWGATAAVNDASNTTYATAGAVKSAYDLASGKLGKTENAVSATKWLNGVTITLAGDATGAVSFDGATAALTLTVAVGDDSHNHAFANLTGKPTTLAGYGITDAVNSTTGKAPTATKLATAHPFTIGLATSKNFDGSGATAMTWSLADIGAYAAAGGGIAGDFWRASGTNKYGLVDVLGWTTDAKPCLVLLAKKYVGTLLGKTGFVGRILFSRGAVSANHQTDYVDVNVSVAYGTNSARLLYRSGSTVGASKIVEVTHNNEVYYALYRSAYPSAEVSVTGNAFDATLPLLIPDASAYSITDVVTTEEAYHAGNKPTAADVAALPISGGTLAGNLAINNGGTNNRLSLGAGSDTGAFRVNDDLYLSAFRGSGSVILEGQSNPQAKVGSSSYNLYHTGYKPTAADVDALPSGGTAVAATKLATARQINGTNFDGSGNITTANWGTARTLTIGNAAKSVNGAGNVSWSLAELGAVKDNAWYAQVKLGTWSAICKLNVQGTLAGKALLTVGHTRNNVVINAQFLVSWGHSKKASVMQLQSHGYTQFKVRVAYISGDDYCFEVFDDAYATPDQAAGLGVSYSARIDNLFGSYVPFTAFTASTGEPEPEISTEYNAIKINTNKVYHQGFKPTAADVGALPSGSTAVAATKLATARQINGTDFDGSGNITTANWGTARTLTVGNAAKSVNGSGNVSWSLAEIGAARARGELASGATENITTDQFVQWLKDSGAFDERVWIARGSWSYANNKTITDTGCGNIHLAGCTIEVISGSEFAFTIRITTPTTTNGGGLAAAEFIYVNNGSNYAPGWRRSFNTSNPPTAEQVGAMAESGSYGTVYMKNWFRSTGPTGWYNETYGGGIHMSDTEWVRTFGNKKFHIANGEGDALNVSGGIYAGGSGSFADVTIRSDRNLKSNFQAIEDGLGKVLQLTGQIYDKQLLGMAGVVGVKREAGLIAQDVEAVLPLGVHRHDDGYLSISQTGLNALFVEAIKGLADQIAQLRSAFIQEAA